MYTTSMKSESAGGSRPRPFRLILPAAFSLLVLFTLAGCDSLRKNAAAEKPPGGIIYRVSIKGAITPSTMDTLDRAIDKAEKNNARALLVELNTPGGLMLSMDEMCARILNAKVPVMTFVWPLGAYAGSAGVYIMYASHVAAMGPATNIGSATPVSFGGGGGKGSDKIPDKAGASDSKNMKRKLFNHAKAQIRAFARHHGRDARFGQRTITHAENITSDEALKRGAIDLTARSVEELIQKAHGRKVQMTEGKKLTLDIKSAKLVDVDEGFRADFLQFLTNPALVQLLLLLGVMGLWIEIQNPGLVIPGAAGVMCLLLGLYGMQQIPIKYAGAALLVLGAIFFMMEVKIVSYGLLSVAGIACFFTGSVLLVRSDEELLWRSLLYAGAATAFVSAIMGFLAYKAIQVMRRAPASGFDKMLTETGTARGEITDLNGKVFIHSELWSARTKTGVIAPGTPVRVVDRQGLWLYVEPADPET